MFNANNAIIRNNTVRIDPPMDEILTPSHSMFQHYNWWNNYYTSPAIVLSDVFPRGNAHPMDEILDALIDENEYCESCGRAIVHPLDAIEVDGHMFCCDICANNEDYYECEHCGDWGSYSYMLCANDNTFFCDEDCAYADGYEQCEHCGDWYDTAHDGVEFQTNDGFFHHYCSDGCAETDGYEQCEHCGEWESSRRMSYVDGNERWCSDCVDDDAVTCHSCGELINYYDAHGSGAYYCHDCWEERSHYGLNVHEYGYTPCLNFYGNPNNGPYLGVELETDGDDIGGYSEALMDIDGFEEHWYMTHDGSLSDDGVELTGHPMTLDYFVDNLEMMEDIRRVALHYEYTSHNNGLCGLHVHVNCDWFGKSELTQNANIMKADRLIARFKNPIMRFTRRTNDRWCHIPDDNEHKFEPGDSVSSILNKGYNLVKSNRCAHSRSINFEHAPRTFEFRIFRGTLNLETFYATLAFVDGLSRLVKNRGTRYVETVRWNQFVEDLIGSVENEYARGCLESYIDRRNLR